MGRASLCVDGVFGWRMFIVRRCRGRTAESVLGILLQVGDDERNKPVVLFLILK